MAQIAGRRLPLLMVAVLLITSLPSFAPGALTRSDRLTGAMAQSLHVSRERALAFEKRQGRLTLIANRLESQIGDAAGGGVWMRNGANATQDLVVNLTTPSLFSMVQAEGARPRLVPRSLGELKRVDGELEAETTREAPGGYVSWYVDREEDVVRLQVARAGLGSAGVEGLLGRARELGAAVKLEIGDFQASQPQADEDVIGGTQACLRVTVTDVCGKAENFTKHCSLAFAVINRNSKVRFVLTAGHCVVDPLQRWLRAKWYSDKNVYIGEPRGYKYGPSDWALIAFEGQARATYRVINPDHQPPFKSKIVLWDSIATEGSQVCNTSWLGAYCGLLFAIRSTVTRPGGHTFKLNKVRGACTLPGTSGMPWIEPSAYGSWLAEGIQSMGSGAQKVDGRWKCAGAVLGHSMDEHIAEYTSMESFMDDTNDQYAIYKGQV